MMKQSELTQSSHSIGMTNLLVIVMENLEKIFHVCKHLALTKREARKKRRREKKNRLTNSMTQMFCTLCSSPSSITGAHSCVLPSDS